VRRGVVWTPDLRYVDTHCHVDLYPNPTAIMQEAERESVGIVAVTNTPSAFEPMVRLASGFSNVVVALGLHPELAIEREAELQLVPGLIKKTPFLGEIGLDGTARDVRVAASQQRVLRTILAHANSDGPRVMTVHTRRAVQAARRGE